MYWNSRENFFVEWSSVFCREVVLILECPLLEISKQKVPFHLL